MNEEKTALIRKKLIERLCLLRGQAFQTVSEMKIEHGNIADFIDHASLEADRCVELAIRTREIRIIRDIMNTIARIDNGSFGMCDACGSPISEKRLMVKPETVYCRKCQEKNESGTRVKNSRPVLDRAA